MEYNYVNLFILFFIYSVLGYIVESISVSMIEGKVVWSRGFLIGPYIPIFGTGSILMVLILKKYYDDIFALFIMSMIVCLTLEYLTSYIGEKLFHLRWWNYSDKKFNINGRICLENGILFGVAGIFIIRYVNSFFEGLIMKMSPHTALVVVIILSVIFYTDFLISLRTVIKFNGSFNKYAKDNTSEVKNKIIADLKENGFLIKRLLRSFPNANDSREHFAKMRENFIKKINDSKNK